MLYLSGSQTGTVDPEVNSADTGCVPQVRG